MGTLIDLRRVTYMKVSTQKTLNYMSAKYKNIKFLLEPQDSYQITSSDASNLPGLAHKFYGDKGYWWIIGLYNGILDPVTDLVPGTVIQLPSLTDINNLLSTGGDTASDGTTDNLVVI
jgi:hypothetical protein